MKKLIALLLLASPAFGMHGELTYRLSNNPPPVVAPLPMGQTYEGINAICNNRPDPRIQQSERLSREISEIQKHLDKTDYYRQELEDQRNRNAQSKATLRAIRTGSSSSSSSFPVCKDESTDEIVRRMAKPKYVINLDSIPDPNVYYMFQSSGKFRDDLERTYKDLYKIQPQFGKQQKAKTFGLAAIEEADSDYALGKEEEAHFFKKLAKEFLDIAIGLDPVTGLGRSAFELLVGRNLITGEKLSELERGFAFIGVVTVGNSRSFTKISQSILKLSHKVTHVLNPKVVREVRQSGDIAQKVLNSVRHIKIKTPYGEVTQELTQEALVVRNRIIEGARIYRAGVKGKNYTGQDAQFWSIEQPNTSHAQRYGMPPENSNFDFIETATVKTNAPFVTKSAPASLDGSNAGGSIEIVVPPGNINIESHTSL